MSTPARLAAFLVVLAAVFGCAFAIGGAFAPIHDAPTHHHTR